jgi:hypothetical protein
MLTTHPLKSFEEATKRIKEIGILPLSSFIPEHPSLESLTEHGQWHTGLESDPWLWRDKFAGEGIAAYGRFFAKKPILIAAEWFPLIKNIIEEPYTVEERYEDGLVPKAAVELYQAVVQKEGIDVKELRALIGMKSKESKSEFDRILIDLQSTGNIVIAGISERLNANGVKSGWNSTCYMTSEHWMELHGLQLSEQQTPEAKETLRTLIKEKFEDKAAIYFHKIFKL